MALFFTASTYNPIQKHVFFIKGVNRAFMPKHSAVPMKKEATVLTICYSIRNKVFEDQSQGIVCYEDEDGQVVCEGYDEGPCFGRHISKQSCHPGDVEFMDIRQQTWLQVDEERKLNHVNGFNTLS